MKNALHNPCLVSLGRGAAATLRSRLDHGQPVDETWNVSAALRRAGHSEVEIEAYLSDRREFARLADVLGSPSLVR